MLLLLLLSAFCHRDLPLTCIAEDIIEDLHASLS